VSQGRTTPLDGPTARQWSRARARAARQHHPDRGGDVDTYLNALQKVDAQFGVGNFGSVHVTVHLDRSVHARLARTVRQARLATRHVLNQLPQRLRPGATYIEL